LAASSTAGDGDGDGAALARGAAAGEGDVAAAGEGGAAVAYSLATVSSSLVVMVPSLSLPKREDAREDASLNPTISSSESLSATVREKHKCGM